MFRVSGVLTSSEREASLVVGGLEDIEGDVADGDDFGGFVAGSGSGPILAEADVERPVETVVDGPVALDSLGAGVGRNGTERNIRIHCPGFVILFPCSASALGDHGEPVTAMLAADVALAREPVDAGGDAGLALLDPAMALVGRCVCGDALLRGIVDEARHLAHAPRLVGFDRQQSVGARIEDCLRGFHIAGDVLQ